MPTYKAFALAYTAHTVTIYSLPLSLCSCVVVEVAVRLSSATGKSNESQEFSALISAAQLGSKINVTQLKRSPKVFSQEFSCKASLSLSISFTNSLTNKLAISYDLVTT